MKQIFLILFALLAMNGYSQIPGKDSLFLKRLTSTYSSTNYTTGQTRGSTSVLYYYKLGKNSEFIKVKGNNYKKIVDVFPASSNKYRQCTSQAKQATLIGAVAIALVGTFISGAIIGAKNIKSEPTKGYVWLGVGAVSLAGIYILPKQSRKKANRALYYFEESADLYNTSVKK